MQRGCTPVTQRLAVSMGVSMAFLNLSSSASIVIRSSGLMASGPRGDSVRSRFKEPIIFFNEFRAAHDVRVAEN
jgi:hypothetical protein